MKFTCFTILLMLFHQVSDSNDLMLTYKEEPIASVNRSEFIAPIVGEPFLDEQRYDDFVEKLDKEIYQAPQNAIIGENDEIVPGKVGYKLHREKLKELFYSYFLNDESSTIEVPILKVYPKVDNELLATIRTQRISRYITHFNSNKEERSHNISLAAEAINNYVVFPGETFSFNEVVGKRTEDKGYKRAPEIVKGEVTEGVGGGICQISSTLFNAVDRAGVQIVHRLSHSKSVPYVPQGRDATVSWYGSDFKFKNNYNQPLLIRAKAVRGQVIIDVYSSDLLEYTPRKVPNPSWKR
ncbi:VanW family protein [Aquibacillus salsiterrae]|uniref:VanW family protein n=1 Tax=Aquibacillus salsiterrae TaxID=2950439 RepID=A0A9X3WGX1_9BACI|nr:VanW family protein [Aquibacillus salsiterrae]MDC3418413.1 VanW family protein [Aquibacillus salsiterrae]